MMYSAETREAQATACLQSAALHREKLLAVAVKLAGSAEAGMDLFQQVALNCHDAIQRNGFTGDRYEFYLLATLRNHTKREKRRCRTVPVDFQAIFNPLKESGEGAQRWQHQKQQWQRSLDTHLTEQGGVDPDAREHLLQQLAVEVKEQLSFNDRILLRLHADGIPYREISQMTGAGHYSRIQRRVEKMKDALRAVFGQTWANLNE